jgi:hypothetical protein
MKVQTRMTPPSPPSSQRSGHLYIHVPNKQSGGVSTKLFTTKGAVCKALENGSLAKILPKWLAIPTGQKSQRGHMQEFIEATRGFIENKDWHLVIHANDEAPQANIGNTSKLWVDHQFYFLRPGQQQASLANMQQYVLEQIARFSEGSEAPTLNPVNRDVPVTRPMLTIIEERLIEAYRPPEGSKKQNKKGKALKNEGLLPSIKEVRRQLELEWNSNAIIKII